jgi:hypothetical protein
MTFEVETGSASPTANSYVSVAEADAYHTLYQNLDWATDGSIPDSQKQLALLHATKSCDLLFGQSYLSMPATSTQALLFPRYTFVINQRQIIPATVIPVQLKNAVCHLALMYILGTDLYPTFNNKSQTGTETVKIGDISTTTVYTRSPNAEQFEGFWHVEMLLAPIIKRSGLANNPSGLGF